MVGIQETLTLLSIQLSIATSKETKLITSMLSNTWSSMEQMPTSKLEGVDGIIAHNILFSAESHILWASSKTKSRKSDSSRFLPKRDSTSIKVSITVGQRTGEATIITHVLSFKWWTDVESDPDYMSFLSCARL